VRQALHHLREGFLETQSVEVVHKDFHGGAARGGINTAGFIGDTGWDAKRKGTLGHKTKYDSGVRHNGQKTLAEAR